MNHNDSIEYRKAIDDFHKARSRARLQYLWASITGQSKELLHFDEISNRLHSTGSSSKGVKEIPVASIVGSVNRYQDFNRNFLPLRDSDMARWARVKSLMTSPGSPGLPPILVYKIGEVYFVMDGNHRVSITRGMGVETIEAHVIEIKSRATFSSGDRPEDIILKSEYNNFLVETRFDELFPGVDLKLTFPGQYETLLEHIRVHRHYMGIEQSREIPKKEAVEHWYDHVYKPVVDVIRRQNILKEFPDLTETDLYLWILDHQSYLTEKYAWSVKSEKAASDLVRQQGRRFLRVVQRTIRKVLGWILPRELEDLTTPGEWHQKKDIESENLFSDILVATNGSAESWVALEQALIIANMENADVHGLFVAEPGQKMKINEQDLEEAFKNRLEQAQIPGNLAFGRGAIAETICDRANLNDLVVLKLSYPPAKNIFSRFSSGFRIIIRRCSRPIIAVNDQVSPMNNLMLAYDGSRKGNEALFVSGYLAKRFGKKLTVLVVEDDDEKGQRLLSRAQDFLGNCCEKTVFIQRKGNVSDLILKTAADLNADMIIMGGYGHSPIFEVLMGSAVDGVLRESRIPIVICQ